MRLLTAKWRPHLRVFSVKWIYIIHMSSVERFMLVIMVHCVVVSKFDDNKKLWLLIAVAAGGTIFILVVIVIITVAISKRR